MNSVRSGPIALVEHRRLCTYWQVCNWLLSSSSAPNSFRLVSVYALSMVAVSEDRANQTLSDIMPSSRLSTSNASQNVNGDGLVSDALRDTVVTKAEEFVSCLRSAAVIPSSSASFECRAACIEAARYVQELLENLGAQVASVAVGYQELSSGEKYDLPPILLADFKNAVKTKPTVLVYANYDTRDMLCNSSISYLSSLLSHSGPLQANGVPGSSSDASRGSAHNVKQNGSNHRARTMSSSRSAGAVSGGGGSHVVSDRDVPSAAAQFSTFSELRLPFSEDTAGILHGFGLSHGKASLLAWICLIDAYQTAGLDLPVNLKLCIEGMANSNSECIKDLVQRECRRGGFMSDVDYVVVNGGQWVAPGKPSLITASRGVVKFDVQVIGGSRNLSAGEFAGCIAEPLTDLVQLLSYVSRRGHGGVDLESFGITKDPILSAEPEEGTVDEASETSLSDLKTAVGGVSRFVGGDDTRAVQINRTTLPAISIHGIEGAPFGRGVSMTIAGTVNGKFSIHLPYTYDAEDVAGKIQSALESRFAELNSPNELFISYEASNAWQAETSTLLFEAAVLSSSAIYGKAPVLTQSGESVSVAHVFDDLLRTHTLLLPLSGPVAVSDVSHPDDDPIPRKDFVSAILMISALLNQIALRHSSSSREASKSTSASSGGTSALAKLRDIWKALA